MKLLRKSGSSYVHIECSCVQEVHQSVWAGVRSYQTRDCPVPGYAALGVDIAGVGQAVAAADLRLAAFQLVSGEARLAGAALIGALCGDEDSYIWAPFIKVTQMKSSPQRVAEVLPQSCDRLSLRRSLHCSVLCIHQCHHTPELCNMRIMSHPKVCLYDNLCNNYSIKYTKESILP